MCEARVRAFSAHSLAEERLEGCEADGAFGEGGGFWRARETERLFTAEDLVIPGVMKGGESGQRGSVKREGRTEDDGMAARWRAKT